MINIQTDSRKVKKGDTFVAIKGDNFDGHDYIFEAIKKGATKIVAEKNIFELVKDTKTYLENYLINNYEDQLKDLIIIGITGTNGKTTTAYLTYQLLSLLGQKTAYIGTIGFYMNNQFIKDLDNTTPSVLDIYKLLLEAKEQGCKYVVMEVSSHALVQKRLAGIKLSLAAFTNLTQDHLDYHKDMQDYLYAKLKILDILKEKAKIIVNADDKFSIHFIKENSLTIGKMGFDYYISSIENNNGSVKVKLIYKNNDYNIVLKPMPLYNVYNHLMALSLVNELGYRLKETIKLIDKLHNPKGRCEVIKINNAFAVVDYAHTPDAVEKIIKSFKEIKQNKLITIIGCGGDRDPKKRPIMAKIGSDLSDYVIFTNDNPRTEDPNKIMTDIIKDLKNTNYEIELDRHLAIKKGIKLLQPNDYLLVLGKGHENYQVIGTKKMYFDDAEEIKKYIK